MQPIWCYKTLNLFLHRSQSSYPHVISSVKTFHLLKGFISITGLLLIIYYILIGFNRSLKASVQPEETFRFSKLWNSLTVQFSSSAAISWTLLIALFSIKIIAQLLCPCCYANSSCLYYKGDVSPIYWSEWYRGE